jgi:hypothetical protein
MLASVLATPKLSGVQAVQASLTSQLKGLHAIPFVQSGIFVEFARSLCRKTCIKDIRRTRSGLYVSRSGTSHELVSSPVCNQQNVGRSAVATSPLHSMIFRIQHLHIDSISCVTISQRRVPQSNNHVLFSTSRTFMRLLPPFPTLPGNPPLPPRQLLAQSYNRRPLRRLRLRRAASLYR